MVKMTLCDKKTPSGRYMNLPENILNAGLNFSMEFGENWLMPINNRLSKIYLELSISELNYCDKLCKKINKVTQNFIKNNPKQVGEELVFIDFAKFEKFMKSQYEWINEDNLSTLYNQGCYYAMK